MLNINDPFAFALAEGGVYFIPRRESKSGYNIQFLNTVTGKIQRIASLEGEPYAPTVSPDQRWILYAQSDRGISNLMLVEDFR